MAQPYRGFGSFVLFQEVLADELGHVYRAGELDRTGLRRTVWLRLFDAPGLPAADLGAQADTVNRVGEVLQSANVGARPRLSTEAGVPALAVDFAPGQPLSLVLRKVRGEGFPVPVDNCLLILEKIALGLAAALAVEVGGNPLVHGALHPGLVLVTHDGEGLVTGFGVADQLLALLDTPAADGLRPYLAPEVLLSRTTTRRGDVYSLGAILFELLTGAPLPVQPEERAAAVEQAEMAYDEQPVPQDIKALLLRALAARPEDRFSSAADFKKELDKLLYGGAYSPTTFNLALFMDRLFRSEIEVEERERAAEARLDVAPYLAPEPPPPPAAAPVEAAPARRPPVLWIAVAAGVAVVGITAALLLRGGGGPATAAPPTPTAEQLEAQRAADQARLKEMVERELDRLMAEKEKEILAELTTRQGKIDELQKRLRDMQQQASPGTGETDQARRDREALERQLAAEQAAKEQRERTLDDERQRALEEARRKAAAAAAATQPSPTAVAAMASPAPEAATAPPAAPTVAVARPTTPPAAPTRVAQADPAGPPPGPLAVTENMFLDPSQVDTRPVVLKEAAVTWPRAALYSRRRGVIILQVTVNAQGRVEEVKVLRADHDGFGIPAAATEAVQKYLFKPGTKNGVNVKTHATVTIPYRFQTR